MKLFEISLPENVNIQYPRDYVKNCCGNIIRIIENIPFEENLIITSVNGWLRFSHGSNATEYLQETVLRLQVDVFEEIMGSQICTLRVVFRDEDNLIGSFPILSNVGTQRDWFRALSSKFIELDFPYEIEVTDRDVT